MTAARQLAPPEPVTVGLFTAVPRGTMDREGTYAWTLTGERFSHNMGRFAPDKIAREARFVLDELGLPSDGSRLPEPPPKRVRAVPPPPAFKPSWAKVKPNAAPGRCRIVGHDHPAKMRGLCRPAYMKARSEGILDLVALPARTPTEAAADRRRAGHE